MKALHSKYREVVYQFFYIPLLLLSLTAVAQYRLQIQPVDKDSMNVPTSAARLIAGLQTNFTGKLQCTDYIFKLRGLLATKGYPSASIDSVHIDSSYAFIVLFLGKSYKWVQINTSRVSKQVLDETGWNDKHYSDKKLDLSEVQLQEQRMLSWFEKNGYPFALVKLDSIQFLAANEAGDEGVTANLFADQGPLYHIDSIRIFGKARIRNLFLQKYLGIMNGSIYNKDKLNNVNRRLLELPYVLQQQRWDITMLGSGSVLNLYLQPKKSSQVNFLIGFLPATTADTKAQLTGDVNLNLKNSLGSGETLFLTWQQLQRQSPRLNLGYQQPYIFNSAFGLDFSFDLLKRDSTFLQLNGQIGIQYLLSANQSGKIFFQNQRTYLLPGGIDTNLIKATKQLPVNIDVSSSSIGVNYEWINTNYRYNPRSGNEFNSIATIGLKKITRNNDIVNLTDQFNPGFSFSSLYDTLKLNSYQFRIQVTGAHYFPVGKRSTLKNAINAGWFESQNIFRNELFQIGGYRLLRGFNEESIYASQYAVLTEELRYLVGLNSYLFVFTDIGATRTHFQTTDFSNSYIGAGVGLAFETKIGLLNFSFAMGKRNDVKFDIREASKIHFGYVNYF